tara:strand:- start:29 stop:640 length:612 start_codon:yes stop_codon:yes gene_type:complete
MQPINQEQVDFLSHQVTTGKSIPGQSLTNSPETPYNWEKPPEFTDYKEASYEVFNTVFNPEVASNLLLSINNGVGVIDLASMILYTGFLEGKWNPDLMMLLSEPTMYMVIALCEKADLEYKLESGDDDSTYELEPEEQVNKLNQGTTYLDNLRKKASTGITSNSIPEPLQEEIKEQQLPASLLSKKEEEKEVTSSNSLLSKGQ